MVSNVEWNQPSWEYLHHRNRANTTNQSLFLQRVSFLAHYCLRLWVRPTINFEVRERAEVGDMAMAGTIFIERFFHILLPECLPYSDFSLSGHKELSLHAFAARFSSCFQFVFYLFQDTSGVLRVTERTTKFTHINISLIKNFQKHETMYEGIMWDRNYHMQNSQEPWLRALPQLYSSLYVLVCHFNCLLRPSLLKLLQKNTTDWVA